MDKNGKLFKKISVIDAFVVLIILILIGGTVYRFTAPAAAVDRGDAIIEYTLMIDGVRDFTLEYYQIGLDVFDRMRNQHIGRIVGVRYEPQYAWGTMLDGSIVHAPRPGVMVVFVDIEANGRITDNSYFAEGTFEVRVGSIVNLGFKYIDVQSTVHTISVRDR